MDMKKIMIAGRLTRDPESRVSDNGTVITSFTVAVNKKFLKNNQPMKDVSFFKVNIFGKKAEYCTKNLRKSSNVFIVGEPEVDNWTNSDGVAFARIVIIAHEVHLIYSKAE